MSGTFSTSNFVYSKLEHLSEQHVETELDLDESSTPDDVTIEKALNSRSSRCISDAASAFPHIPCILADQELEITQRTSNCTNNFFIDNASMLGYVIVEDAKESWPGSCTKTYPDSPSYKVIYRNELLQSPAMTEIIDIENEDSLDFTWTSEDDKIIHSGKKKYEVSPLSRAVCSRDPSNSSGVKPRSTVSEGTSQSHECISGVIELSSGGFSLLFGSSLRCI